MKIPFSWLKEWIPWAESADQIAKLLTNGGIEVERVHKIGPLFKGVVIGKLLKVNKHPNADKLSLCDVDVGTEQLKIVCGAKNVYDGAIVPVAKIGAILPNNFKISQAKLRGVESYGMICSEKELALADISEGIYLLDKAFPKKNFVIGESLEKALSMEQDEILEISITPNRGDCLSVRGIAREAALLKGEPFQDKEIKNFELKPGKFQVNIQEPVSCSLYSGIVIENIQVQDSPDWLKARLEKCGQRAINNIVDITNYVLLEMGQPLHAFNLEKISGTTITVRNAQPKELFPALDGNVYELASDAVIQETGNLVIADQEKVLALAGVIGGSNSEVSTNTKNILLEAAYFNPASVRIASKAYKINTESSYRFERKVDLDNVLNVQKRAVELILQLCPNAVVKEQAVSDLRPRTILSVKIWYSQINKILGINFPKEQVYKILECLSSQKPIECDKSKPQKEFLPLSNQELLRLKDSNEVLWLLYPPSWRPDLESEIIYSEIHYIEEIARIVGYDQIKAHELPAFKSNPAYQKQSMHKYRHAIRGFLNQRGFQDIRTLSFVGDNLLKKTHTFSQDLVKVFNPLSEEHGYLRPSLFPSLLSVFEQNIKNGNECSRIFEVSKTFKHQPKDHKDPYQESWKLGMLATGSLLKDGWSGKNQTLDFLSFKGIVEDMMNYLNWPKLEWKSINSVAFLHPSMTAEVYWNGQSIGYFGVIHPELAHNFEISKETCYGEIDLKFLEAFTKPTTKYHSFSRYPAMSRDMSIVVEKSLPAESVRQFLLVKDPGLIEDVRLFDMYQGERIAKDKKSLAFTILYRSKERTLTDAEVDQHLKQLTQEVVQKFHCSFQ